MNLAPYRKTIVAVITGLIGWAAAVVASEPTAITASEWIFGATALATALGVYQVANTPTAEWPEAGQAGLPTVAWVLVIVLLIVVLVRYL